MSSKKWEWKHSILKPPGPSETKENKKRDSEEGSLEEQVPASTTQQERLQAQPNQNLAKREKLQREVRDVVVTILKKQDWGWGDSSGGEVLS